MQNMSEKVSLVLANLGNIPKDEKEQLAKISQAAVDLLGILREMDPEKRSREISIAITKLEECLLWANCHVGKKLAVMLTSSNSSIEA